jgi:beta-lysine 5,6-aminomutase alpha subunit
LKSKLGIDFEIVKRCRDSADNISASMQKYVEKHSTVSVERTVCRLLGIDGVDKFDVPLPNVVVEALEDNDRLKDGAAYFFGNAMLQTGMNPNRIAQCISTGDINVRRIVKQSSSRKVIVESYAKEKLNKIRKNKSKREKYLKTYGDKTTPLLYVIVATGNIYEDITQAVAAAEQGADVIAVIRTTGQSLLDYVPYGATTEGFGGTYATQENFRLMRKALDKAGEKLSRYIRLCNYCSGLCMPEIAAMGAFERLDMMLNDALYGILFRDINMKRTMIDQHFSRVINAYAGVIINTGEDNYLTTSDAYEEAHTVLASQFINEQLAKRAGLREEQMGLGHAFEMSPQIENAFVYELAQAQMAREIFPNASLKYMPPTKHMTGDIFMGNVQDALFNMISIITNQNIHLLGMLTEAIHTPFMADRAIAIENASYIFRTMEKLGEEIEYKKDGVMAQRASHVLQQALNLILKIEKEDLFNALEKGVFAGVKRPQDGGKGLKGVFKKSDNYFNPFIDFMLDELKGGRA